jgi:hypothetical protein
MVGGAYSAPTGPPTGCPPGGDRRRECLSVGIPTGSLPGTAPGGAPTGPPTGCLLGGVRWRELAIQLVFLPRHPLERRLEGRPSLGADISPIFHTCLCTLPAPGRASTA